ncbi:hypothetical protein V1264_006572 [Littorina saxatilis]
MNGERFVRCLNGLTNSASTSEVSGRSSMDCIQMCSRTHDCSGVNICPGSMSGQFKCGFTVGLHQGDCMDMSAASQPSCYYVQRKDKTVTTTTTSVTTTTTPTSTTPLLCQNGGTLNGNQCDCLYKYIGAACEKHARDCSEAYDNGKQDGAEEALFIRPTGAPAPIKVRCQYSWGGATILLQWKSSISNFNQDFATLKAGIGDDPMVGNYFVGLDSLYYFTSQADYELNFQANNFEDHIYNNFTFGPESSSYAISYDQFSSGIYGDGFAVSPPLTFSAEGHDTDGCYAAKGKAGWYGAGCTGYPTFTDGNFDWSNGNEGTVSVDSLFMKFVRQSPYYDD